MGEWTYAAIKTTSLSYEESRVNQYRLLFRSIMRSMRPRITVIDFILCKLASVKAKKAFKSEQDLLELALNGQ